MSHPGNPWLLLSLGTAGWAPDSSWVLPVPPLAQICVSDLCGSSPPLAVDPDPYQNKNHGGKKRHLTSVTWAGEWEVSRCDSNHISPCLWEREDRDLTAMGATWPWPQKTTCFVSSLVLPQELLSTSVSSGKNTTFLPVKTRCWICVGVTKRKFWLCLKDLHFHLGNDVFID